jgi:hypothetical protein
MKGTTKRVTKRTMTEGNSRAGRRVDPCPTSGWYRHRVQSAGLGLMLLFGAVGAGMLGAGCGSQDEERPATWNYIATAIIEPNCATANCHSNLAQRSGVQLDRQNRAYHALVDRFFVIPGDPDNSALMNLLKGEGSRRMPPDFPLADQDIALIAQWIKNGANP